MTDEELIEMLRAGPEIVYRYVSVDHAAADRIEQLVNDNHRWKNECEEFWRKREETAEAKLARALDAIKLMLHASHISREMVSLGAWPIEEDRAVLAELEKKE